MADEREGWHISRQITLGHIVTTLMLFAGLVGIYTDNQAQHQDADKRITVVETQVRVEHEANQQDRARTASALSDISKKLDRLIERELDRGSR